jgi:hypothetical protein
LLGGGHFYFALTTPWPTLQDHEAARRRLTCAGIEPSFVWPSLRRSAHVSTICGYTGYVHGRGWNWAAVVAAGLLLDTVGCSDSTLPLGIADAGAIGNADGQGNQFDVRADVVTSDGAAEGRGLLVLEGTLHDERLGDQRRFKFPKDANDSPVDDHIDAAEPSREDATADTDAWEDPCGLNALGVRDGSVEDGGVAVAAADCGPDKIACAATTCSPEACFAPSHLPTSAGTWARTAGVAEFILTAGPSESYPAVFITDDGSSGFNTHLGISPIYRPANRDPRMYEVQSGIGFVRIAQAPGEPDLGIWVFKSFTLTKGAINFEGNSIPVFLCAGDVTIAGDVNVSRRGFFGGGAHGQNSNAEGCAPGQAGDRGGGGGGFGTDGASAPTGAMGGLASACARYNELTPLRGGSGGGAGATRMASPTDQTPVRDQGGSGGGALQIIAAGKLSVLARIAADGAGVTAGGSSLGSGGAGSGGAIFLESPQIVINGTCRGTLSAQGGVPGMEGGNGGLGRIILRTLPGKDPILPNTAGSVVPGPGSDAFRILRTLGQP